MDQYVFRRREQKYLLPESAAAQLRQLMAQHMDPDRYAKSTVCSIYYDTPDCRIIRRSLEKPEYKEKLRLRSYGQVTPEQTVFLELKKKYKGVVYKRRVSLPYQQAVAYMADPDAVLDCGQIGREIDYCKGFYGTLRPMLQLSYERLAWRSHDGSIRVTLDWDLRFRIEAPDLTAPISGEKMLPEGQYLMEIKVPESMPLWLTEFLSRHRLYKTSFSKYGRVYETCLMNKIKESRDYDYA